MNYIKGMDVSSYQEMLDKGYLYYDEHGNQVDILEYAVSKGFNYGRIRIWNEPQNIPESGGYCDLNQTIQLAKKLKSFGIPYLLDFHYSDWWADPGHQNKPKAWEYLHGVELQNAISEYTCRVLNTLGDNGASPSMVQVGNEIRCGMLWPDGSTEDYRELAKLINAGITGVRKSADGPNIKIMLHLDQGGRYHYFEEWFDKVIMYGVKDFDVIGLSYYPFWHGTYKDLDDTMNKLALKYNKDLVVAETAYGYRLGADSLFGNGHERLGGFMATHEGQEQALKLISGIIAGVTNNKGLGFFYWEPFMRSEEDNSWGYCMSLVDEKGNPLTALLNMNNEIPISVNVARKIYNSISYNNESLGTIEGEDILDQIHFSDSMDDWTYTAPSNVSFDIKEDNNKNIFCFKSKGNVNFIIEKKITISQSGNYSFVVDYKGDNTTGVFVKPYMKFEDYTREMNIYPSDSIWTRGTITEDIVAGSQIKVGIEIDSPESWGEIKGFYLCRK